MIDYVSIIPYYLTKKKCEKWGNAHLSMTHPTISQPDDVSAQILTITNYNIKKL